MCGVEYADNIGMKGGDCVRKLKDAEKEGKVVMEETLSFNPGVARRMCVKILKQYPEAEVVSNCEGGRFGVAF